MSVQSHEISDLYKSEHDRLERQIRYRVGCRFTAADLVQDLFLRLWQGRWPLSGNRRAYLSLCARNAAIDHLRQEQSRARALAGLSPEQIATVSASSEEILVARQSLGELERVLLALPEDTRQIFVLNRIHDCSFSEIAEATGLSRRTVASRMADALAACAGVKTDA